MTAITRLVPRPRLLVAAMFATAATLAMLVGWGQVHAAPIAYCSAERFSDVCPADWFYPHVLDLANMGAISGYGDNTFRPFNTITRGQAMKIIVSATALIAPAPSTSTFADVNSANPFYDWIEVGAARGLTSGYNCGTRANEPCDAQNRPYFRPGVDVNRGQLAKMVVVARGWEALTPANASFSDVGASNVFFGAVERAAANGIISGYADGTFRPFNPVTRSQASKIVNLARLWGKPGVATPTAAPTGTSPKIAGCDVFPANNIWNRNIATLPVHSRSAQYMASIGLQAGVHPDFGSGTWQGEPIGIPYTTVPGTQPGVNVTFRYDEDSDRPPYPIPTNAPIETGSSDAHVLVIDRDNCVLHELFDAHPQSDGSWQAGSGARWSLLSNTLRPDGWTSADAAGLPMFPGLARYEEAATGVIRHALRFTAPRTQDAHIWPARHDASDITDPNVPPMGLRVRLKASVNISGYSTQTRIVLQTLKDYGMFLSDNGSPWYISGIPDERWDNDNLVNELDDIIGSDFEAVDESGLMVDPNSAESR